MGLDPRWTATIDAGAGDRAWDEYDPIILREVVAYNLRLAGTTNFAPFTAPIFKAMLWVESGGPANPAWKTRPMQIGNSGDPGWKALQTGEGAVSVVLSDDLKAEVARGNVNNPELNVRFGMAYAISRLAESDIRSIDDPADATIRDYKVVAGDNPSTIARKVGSTTASIAATNPGMKVLHAGQTIRYRKASMGRVITDWRETTPRNLADRYNTGDPLYAEKLAYVLNRLRTPRP